LQPSIDYIRYPENCVTNPKAQNEYDGANDPKQLIGTALKKRIENIDHHSCEPGDEDTFFVADLGEVYRQHMRWKFNLPRVKPFYGRSSVIIA
jgi:ornithine decarboxylase